MTQYEIPAHGLSPAPPLLLTFSCTPSISLSLLIQFSKEYFSPLSNAKLSETFFYSFLTFKNIKNIAPAAMLNEVICNHFSYFPINRLFLEL